MSQQNVQVVRDCFARFGERDLEGFLTLIDPEVQWLPASSVVGDVKTPPYHGHPGVQAWFGEVTEAVGYTVNLQEILEGTEDRVLVKALVIITRIGAEPSGAPLVYYVFELRDGRVFRLKTYLDEAEAHEAAGLAPQAP